MGEILLPERNMCERNLENKGHENSVIESDNFRSGSKTFLCSQCGKAFRSKDTLLRHKISHSGAKPFSCDICKKGLSSAVSLKEHKAKHNDQTLYECSVCHRGFRQNSSYRRHLITHSKASPYECGLCKQRFSQQAYLRSHVKVHTGEKPYLCDPSCGKSFAHLSDLNRHRILHTGKRPYKCDICGSSFADRSSRRRHQKDHESKPQKHACEVCKSTFKRAVQLKRHMSKAHGVTSFWGLKNMKNLKNFVNNSSTQICENGLDFSAVGILSSQNGAPVVEMQIPNMQKSEEIVPLEIPVDDSSTQESHPQVENCHDAYSVSTTNSSDTSRTTNSCSSSEILLDAGMAEPLKSPKQNAVETSAVLPVLPSTDYVLCPDFSSQEYYEWLTRYVSLCKLLPCPIETEVFSQMNVVLKSIMDCLSNPSELVCGRTNFRTLIELSQDLFKVMNGQLNFILNQLPD